MATKRVEKRGRKSRQHEIASRHITPIRIYDDAVVAKMATMTEELIRRTRNPNAKVTYTDVVMWMAEKTLASEHAPLGEFVMLNNKLKRMIA